MEVCVPSGQKIFRRLMLRTAGVEPYKTVLTEDSLYFMGGVFQMRGFGFRCVRTVFLFDRARKSAVLRILRALPY